MLHVSITLCYLKWHESKINKERQSSLAEGKYNQFHCSGKDSPRSGITMVDQDEVAVEDTLQQNTLGTLH